MTNTASFDESDYYDDAESTRPGEDGEPKKKRKKDNQATNDR